jgi:hypothetical protein
MNNMYMGNSFGGAEGVAADASTVSSNNGKDSLFRGIVSGQICGLIRELTTGLGITLGKRKQGRSD